MPPVRRPAAMIDVDAFQREAVKAACGPDTGPALSRLNLAWQAAHVLKGADPAELNDYRLEAHKAFRDANPGPTSRADAGDGHAREVQPAADHRRARSVLDGA